MVNINNKWLTIILPAHSGVLTDNPEQAQAGMKNEVPPLKLDLSCNHSFFFPFNQTQLPRRIFWLASVAKTYQIQSAGAAKGEP